MSKKVTVGEGQTLLDIAYQEGGCFEALAELAKLNKVSQTIELVAGQQVTVWDVVPELTPNNRAVAAYYKVNSIVINSGYGLAEETEEEVSGYVNPGYVNPGYVN